MSSRSTPSRKHKIQLRTAPRKAQQLPSHLRGSTDAEDRQDQEKGLTPKEHRARQSHNLVEKKYRKRLNEQFVSLLAVLPAETSKDGMRGEGTEGEARDDERRLSKAEVLDIARQRILALEGECSKLDSERRTLLDYLCVLGEAAT